YPGKDDLLVLDVVGVTARHDLMTIAQLFDLDPKALDAETVAEAVPSQRRRSVVHTAHGDLVQVDVIPFCPRPMQWVNALDGAFTLSLGKDDGGVVLTSRNTGHREHWNVLLMSPKGILTPIASGQSLAYAQGRAEDYVRRMGSGGLV